MLGFKFPAVLADIVTLSHDHDDHNKADQVSEVKKVVSGPGEYEISGVSIIGLPSFHDDKKGEERGKNTIYIFEMDDLRIVHFGDLGHKLPESVLEDLGTVDIMMVPVGGFYTIGAGEASELVASVEPGIVIPMHYLVPGMNLEVFGKLSKVDDFLKEVGLPVENSDKLSIKKEELSEEQKIVVLNRK